MNTRNTKTKLLISLSFLTAVLGGCSNSAREVNYPVRPAELKDCKIYRLTNDEGGVITVARCPNSTTTTTMNHKGTPTAVVVDGVE